MRQNSPWQFIEVTTADDGDSGTVTVGLSGYPAGDEVAESYVLLAILLGSVTVLGLLLWRAFSVPGRVGPAVMCSFSCPVLEREVIAEVRLDPAEKRAIDVLWCTGSCPAAIVTCTRHCLMSEPLTALAPAGVHHD